MTVTVNEECIGCTLCTQICPEVFKMSEDKAVAYRTPVPAQYQDGCRQATEQCPVEAIVLRE